MLLTLLDFTRTDWMSHSTFSPINLPIGRSGNAGGGGNHLCFSYLPGALAPVIKKAGLVGRSLAFGRPVISNAMLPLAAACLLVGVAHPNQLGRLPETGLSVGGSVGGGGVGGV